MLRRTTAILATTAVLALAFIGPAQAQEAPKLGSYDAGATATALQIALAGQGLAVSHTEASVNSTPQAAANGAALLLAGNAVPGEAPSAAPEGPATAEQCPLDLSALTEALAGTGLTLDVACVETSADITNGSPSAHSETGEVVIRIQGLSEGLAATLGETLKTVLGAVLTPGSDLVTQLCTGPLAIVCDTVNELTSVDLQALVNEIFNDLLEVSNGLFTLAEIFVAPTVSDASATSTGVDAAAGAGAVTINLFPGLASTIETVTGLVIPDADGPSPLLSVQLGQTTAKVHRDPITGEAAPDASAAQLLDIGLTDNLGILSDLLGVQVPGLLDSLAEAGAALSCDGGALADVLCIDLGAVNELDEAELAARNLDYGPGTVGREASAASIQVLPILTQFLDAPLLALSLSSATAAANAAPAAAPPAQPETPITPQESLPRTGGDAALPLTLALFAVGAAGLVFVRRTRAV